MSYTSRTVWVDLDATLARYDGWKGLFEIGQPLEGAREFMQKLELLGKKLKFRVGILTTRTKCDFADRDLVEIEGRHPQLKAITEPVQRQRYAVGVAVGVVYDWLRCHDIPFDEVYCGQGKPPGLAYVDDRAVALQPQLVKPDHRPAAYRDALLDIEALAEAHQ